ncbi:TPA: FCD domain-containing protein [Staphylococcus aureus]
MRQLYKDHERIYQAIMDKQPEEAERAMLTHLEKVEQLLGDVLQEQEGKPDIQ